MKRREAKQGRKGKGMGKKFRRTGLSHTKPKFLAASQGGGVDVETGQLHHNKR